MRRIALSLSAQFAEEIKEYSKTSGEPIGLAVQSAQA
jgi:hypothetical protein